VRGFDGETILSAERGWLVRNDLSAALGASGQELYLGIDYGEVAGTSTQYLVGRRLAGAVLGLRGYFKGLSTDVFIGQPLSKPEGFRSASYTAGFNLNWAF
jgi:hemolysin activation/secretion protein